MLELYIEEVIPTDDLDELSALIREAIDEKIGESEYMIQDVGIQLELQD